MFFYPAIGLGLLCAAAYASRPWWPKEEAPPVVRCFIVKRGKTIEIGKENEDHEWFI